MIKHCWFKNPNLTSTGWQEHNKERIEILKNRDRNKTKDRDKSKDRNTEDLLASQPSQAFFTTISPNIEELLRSQPGYG
ncbi:hypothetical protein PABG_12246 [Paracoccidioides brasiliensis Pb03]|nr:hypothetical protein PABG_12246 [Paracoccidioides brasiliensis Pb03]